MAPGLPFAFFIISSLPEYLEPFVAGDPLAQQGHRGDAVVGVLDVAVSAGLELGLEHPGLLRLGYQPGIPGVLLA